MPVDKFGRTQIGETPSTAEGVSLSYISRNFQRKGDIIDMTDNPLVNVSDPVNPQDAATKNYVLDTIERLVEDFIQISGTDDIVTKSYVDDQLRSRKPLITVFAEKNGSLKVDHTEWSFGNGASANPTLGYPMPVTGRII